MLLEQYRKDYHAIIFKQLLSVDKSGIPSLRELIAASNKLGNEAVSDILETLVKGKRLRDISDLPFDLAI